MGKKYLEDEEEFEWDDEYEWDDRYDELDSSDEFEEETDVTKKTTSAKSGKTSSAGKSSKAAAGKSGSKSKSSAAKGSAASGKKTGKKNSAKKKKRRRMMIIAAVLEVLLLVIVCAGLFIVGQFNKIQQPSGNNKVEFGPNGGVNVNDLPNDTLEQMKGYTTYAIFGLDKRNMEQLNDGLSDVIMLVSVNNDTGEINMASVYRDTYLQIDTAGNFSKINAAYSKGGPVQAIEALNTNLDLQIDHYVTVNWYAVAQTIDLLGGVEIEISEELFYAKEPNWGGTWLNSYIEQTAKATGLPVSYPEGPGYQILSGVEAVGLCRIRQVGLDYGRTDNQRQVVAQVFEKAKKANMATLIDISKSVFPNILTDMSFADISRLLPDITKFYLNESAGFPSKRGGAYIDGPGDCIIAKDLLTNVGELHRILYRNEQYAPSDTVITISEMISRATNIYAD